MKKINMLKIIMFLFIILVPIVTFNLKKDVVSEIDNRKLMNIEDIFTGDDLTKGIEGFIDDRIGLRNKMVNAYNRSMDVLFDEMVHPNYQYGHDDYVFSKVEEVKFDSEFQEVFAIFIKSFQEYCESRGIGFLYAVEPSKEIIYSEYLPKGYQYSNDNIDYFLSLLEDNNVNLTNNIHNLLKYKDEALLYDKEYDARHWNETGAIIGVSEILKDLNNLDSRVGGFDINRYYSEEKVNTFLPNSNFSIDEKTITYNLKNDNSQIINDFDSEIKMDSNYHNFYHYKNYENKEGPRILIFAGSYFNDKEKFLIDNFSEIIKVHNYRNVVNYEYYINIFKPDIVLFESTEYTHMNYYFPLNEMKYKIVNKNLKEYNDLIKDNFVSIAFDELEKSGDKITSIKIPIESNELLYAYANINNRVLDLKINTDGNKKYIEFSLITSELDDMEVFDIYFISNDEERYQKSEIPL